MAAGERMKISLPGFNMGMQMDQGMQNQGMGMGMQMDFEQVAVQEAPSAEPMPPPGEPTDEEALELLFEVLRNRPHLAPKLALFMIPDMTFGPAKSVTENRFTGQIAHMDMATGWGAIHCPDLKEVFGDDVLLHRDQMGPFGFGDEIEFATLIGEDGKPRSFDLTPIGGFWQAEMNGKGKGFKGDASSFIGFGKGDGKGCFKGGGKGAFDGGFAFDGANEQQQPGGGMAKVNAPCKFFQEGRCSRGAACNFIHEGLEAPVAAPAAGNQERYKGQIRQLHLDKGFGFIDCASLRNFYGRDVWVHAAQVEGFNVGDNCTFSIVMSNEGQPQAIGLKPVGKKPPPVEVPVPNEQDRFVGTVKKVEEKGFGFLECPDVYSVYHRDTWVHQKHLKGFNVGDQVTFSITLSKEMHPQGINLMHSTGEETNEAAERLKMASPPERHIGSIKTLHADKGFGFIESPTIKEQYGRDVWIHPKQFSGFNTGDKVSFTLAFGGAGQPQGIDIEPVPS